MQNELKIMKEFRKKRAEMQQQLENLHVSLEEGESEHKTTVSQLEQRFFEEKVETMSVFHHLPISFAYSNNQAHIFDQ